VWIEHLFDLQSILGDTDLIFRVPPSQNRTFPLILDGIWTPKYSKPSTFAILLEKRSWNGSA
jgi:hypothetical protein